MKPHLAYDLEMSDDLESAPYDHARSVRQRTAIAVGAAALAIVASVVLLGCGDKTAPSSSTPKPSKVAPPRHAKRPATVVSPTARKPKRRPAITITGFGARQSDWDAIHSPDNRFTPGSAYDPVPSLARGGDTRFDDSYYGVSAADGRVTNYEMRFPRGTSITEAKTNVLDSEFPSDARIVWFKRRSTCAQMLVRSTSLARSAHASALVEFGSGAADDRYDARDVWTALLQLLPPHDPGKGMSC